MKEAFHGGFGIVVLVLSLLVVAAAVFIALSLYTGQSSVGSENITTPVERARSIECEAQIRKVKMQLQLYRYENDRYPESLGSLEGLSATDFCCPVTSSPYDYDAGSGLVSCPDHKR
jgi:competence protein ComGC